jgi:amidase
MVKTDGSIVCPSSKSNLVGIKPTVGLTSRYLVIPLSEHQDTIGPIARTVKDAAQILQAIAGIDSSDNYTLAIPNKGKLPDYVAACRLSALKGARIGIPRNEISRLTRDPAQVNFELDEFDKALSVLKQAGAIVIDPANFTEMQRIQDAEFGLVSADFPVNLLAYTSKLTVNPHNITDLASLRNFTRTFAKEEYPSRDTSLWDYVLEKKDWNNTNPRFWTAYQEYVQANSEGALLGTLKRENLNALLMPTSFSPMWAAGIGTPIVNVPLGFSPSDTPVRMDSRGDLVATAPGIP